MSLLASCKNLFSRFLLHRKASFSCNGLLRGLCLLTNQPKKLSLCYRISVQDFFAFRRQSRLRPKKH